MAKKSSIEKNNRRKRMAKNSAARRAKLKAIIADGEYKTIFNKYFPGVPVPSEFGG